jgi:hypothetical protein
MGVRIVTAAGVITRPETPEEAADVAARAAQAAADALPKWRARATLSRMDMALALEAAGILTETQMLELCGGNIPAPLEAFILMLPEADRKFARAATAAGQPFARSSPMWSAVSAHEDGPTESQIDAIFGWSE